MKDLYKIWKILNVYIDKINLYHSLIKCTKLLMYILEIYYEAGFDFSKFEKPWIHISK